LLNQDIKPALTETHYKILEERDANLDKSELLTWDEVKANARAAKN